MAALNPQQAAAVMAGAMALVLCSCSGNTDPAPSPTVSVEQTVVEPGPTTSPETVEPTVVPDTVPEAGAWAADRAGYEFSEDPQDAAEQWLYDTYPSLWAEGVRKVSASQTTVPLLQGQGVDTPAALVQYIDGKRYDGTEKMPLGFRGQNPDVMPTDVVENIITQYREQGRLTGTNDKVNSGAGGYTISIIEDQRENHISNEPDADTTLTYTRQEYNEGPIVGARKFGNYEEAFEWVLASDFTPPGGDRALYPGEISQIEGGVLTLDGMRYGIYNPATDAIEWFDF